MLSPAKLTTLHQHYHHDDYSLGKIEAVMQAFHALDNHRLPEEPLPKLLESLSQLRQHPQRLDLDEDLSDFRLTLIEKYGLWFLPSQKWIQDLMTWANGRPIIELMAGNAAVTATLKRQNYPATAVDQLNWLGQDNQAPNPWTSINQQDALLAVQDYFKNKEATDQEEPIFLLAWAPDTTDLDWQILQFLRQQSQPYQYLVIGEKNGATNSKKFWQESQLKEIPLLRQNYQPFDMIDDQVYAVK